MVDLVEYRNSKKEVDRVDSLMRLLPVGQPSALEIGARDGHISRMLASRFDKVTALDLVKPQWDYPRIETVQGDVTKLAFPDNSFDTVVCTEVLEHIPPVLLKQACDELKRVARRGVVIGVPFQQDLRVDCTTCRSCGKVNPPWGHVNSFSKERLAGLFQGLEPAKVEYVGAHKARTNFISAFLMNIAGNPWGSYVQEEPCVYCESKLTPPAKRTAFQKLCSKAAFNVNELQGRFLKETPIWIHILFQKKT